MKLLTVERHFFIGFVVATSGTKFFGLTNHSFELFDRFQATLPFEAIDMNFYFSGGADDDFVFSKFHGDRTILVGVLPAEMPTGRAPGYFSDFTRSFSSANGGP